jgi:hypothetical protein
MCTSLDRLLEVAGGASGVTGFVRIGAFTGVIFASCESAFFRLGLKVKRHQFGREKRSTGWL